MNEAAHTADDDVARLICGSVEDLKSMLPHETRADIIERALLAASTRREHKTKAGMLARHLRKLRRNQSPS